MNIKWVQLMSVCGSKMFTDCFANPEDYDHEIHCDAKSCECLESSCPVWERWKNEENRD